MLSYAIQTPAGPGLLFEDDTVYINGLLYAMPAGAEYLGIREVGDGTWRVYLSAASGVYSFALTGEFREDTDLNRNRARRLTKSMPPGSVDRPKP